MKLIGGETTSGRARVSNVEMAEHWRYLHFHTTVTITLTMKREFHVGTIPSTAAAPEKPIAYPYSSQCISAFDFEKVLVFHID